MADSPLFAQLHDEGLDQYATSTVQPKYRAAVVEHGGFTAAATALGVHRTTIRKALYRLVTSAAKQGYAPVWDQIHPAPPGQSVKGVSTLYDGKGDVRSQWVKTQADQEDLREQLRGFVAELCESVAPTPPTAPPEGLLDSDLLAVYPLGDPHLGLMAWSAETGESYDLDIASRDLRNATETLIRATPPCETALVIPLGDTLHADNASNLTPKSGNPLDVDGRHVKVLRVATRLMTDTIQLALGRHKQVVVRVVEGNHDVHSSMALALILDAYYHNEPRVTVDVSPAAHWYMRFGKVLIGTTHGHTSKLNDLGAIMAADMPKGWGESQYRYWYTGHRHNRQIIELTGGVLVEVARTLAAKDAWHAAQGYRSGRDIQSIVHHKQWGEVERHTCSINRARGGR